MREIDEPLDACARAATDVPGYTDEVALVPRDHRSIHITSRSTVRSAEEGESGDGKRAGYTEETGRKERVKPDAGVQLTQVDIIEIKQNKIQPKETITQ